jgi:hypothetical protein
MKAQKRLVEAGWLRCVHRGQGPEASTWTLGPLLQVDERFRTNSALTPPPGGDPIGAVLRAGDDAARWGALGSTAPRIHEALVKSGLASAAELSSGIVIHTPPVGAIGLHTASISSLPPLCSFVPTCPS